MFKRNRDYKSQLLEKSADVAEVLSERVHDLSKQAERRAGAVATKVRPRRRGRVLRTIGMGVLLFSAVAGVIYFLKRMRHGSEAESYFGDDYNAWSPSTSTPSAALGGEMPGTETMPDRTSTMTGGTEGSGRSFDHFRGKEVVDLNGSRIGEAVGVYYRNSGDEAEWVIVREGIIDTQDRLVPLDGAIVDERVKLAYTEEQVKNGPTDAGEDLDLDTEMRLYAHYGARRTLPDGASPLEEDPLRRWILDDESDESKDTHTRSTRSRMRQIR